MLQVLDNLRCETFHPCLISLATLRTFLDLDLNREAGAAGAKEEDLMFAYFAFY